MPTQIIGNMDTEQVDDFVNWKDFEKSWKKNRVLFIKPAEIKKVCMSLKQSQQKKICNN